MNKTRNLHNGKFHQCIESKEFRENQGMEARSMLKKLNGVLNILIISLIGVFAGHAIYVCLDYRTHPRVYAMQSVPWYTGILYYGIYTIALLIIAIIIKLILCRKLKQQK